MTAKKRSAKLFHPACDLPWIALLVFGLLFLLPGCQSQQALTAESEEASAADREEMQADASQASSTNDPAGVTARGSEQAMARLSEGYETIKTYPFGDPSPIPIFADITNQRGDLHIYPYFSFSEYSHDGVDRQWNVIRMENDFIEVSILPEVGGKVWGAIEKSTGRDFIYKNRVKKFRNIALRGPWTSGGIEFNFGIIGHTPTTSTPVDYLTRENPDGSVSTIIGALDLPSRTEWRVTITLPEDKAYFETESFWYNPTPLEQSNYVWMNAAVEAKDDLQFFFPGTHHVGHSGDAHPWPVNEEGRDLSWYKDNDFGGSKSYHVLGEKTEYYGGYWHDEEVGFVNWSHYHDMPGKKLWIWALSRAGGIWEDLLTDEDGQYVEVQSGRLFTQAIGRSIETPFNHDALDVGATDRWTEAWFPVKQTGGISAATPYGVLHLEESDGETVLNLMALQPLDDELIITLAGEPVGSSHVTLDPMQVYREPIHVPAAGEQENLRIVLGNNKLVYNSQSELQQYERPLETKLKTDDTSASDYYLRGRNRISNRDVAGAYEDYYSALAADPSYTAAQTGLADLYYRRGEYQKALQFSGEALSHNTYDPDANYIHGIIHARAGESTQALEALGWAARSVKYRSAANATMAEIYLETGRHDRAIEYANRSLEFNQSKINAYKVLAVAHRKQEQTQKAHSILDRMLEVDPLNHFANFERYLLEQNGDRLAEFNGLIRNELPHETYLELAVYYANLGFDSEAIAVLEQAPETPMVQYWLAYLNRDQSPQASRRYLGRAIEDSPYLVFPFRMESVPVLKWAEEQSASWKNNYYLGLVYWYAARDQDAYDQFSRVGDRPDYAPFYLLRGGLRYEMDVDSELVYQDFTRALELDPREWRNWHYLNTFYFDEGLYENALERAEQGFEQFPENDALAIDYAHALLYNGRYEACVDHLQQIRILPFYQSGLSRSLFEQANVFAANKMILDGQLREAVEYLENAKTWPDNLAVGKPFDPDLRLQDFLKASIHRQMGNHDRADELYSGIIDYTQSFPTRFGTGHYAAVLALRDSRQEEEARRLLDEWQQAQPDRPVTRWAVAHFTGDEATRRQLEQEHDEDLSFRMLAESVHSTSYLAGL